MIYGGGYNVKVFKDGIYWHTFDNIYLANVSIKSVIDWHKHEWTHEKIEVRKHAVS